MVNSKDQIQSTWHTGVAQYMLVAFFAPLRMFKWEKQGSSILLEAEHAVTTDVNDWGRGKCKSKKEGIVASV